MTQPLSISHDSLYDFNSQSHTHPSIKGLDKKTLVENDLRNVT